MRGPFGGSGFLTNEQFRHGRVAKSLGDPKTGLSEELDALADYVPHLALTHAVLTERMQVA